MEQDNVKVLAEARRQMVEKLHAVMRTLAFGHDPEQLESHINMMMKVQNAIDVIDRVSRSERAPSAN
jgi:hypothetical protein